MPTVSVASVCVAGAGTVASCLATATMDARTGARVLVGRAAAGSAVFFVVSLLSGLLAVPVGDGAAVSFRCAVVVVGSGSSFVRPPVPTTTPGGTERTAPSLVFVPVVPVVEVLVAVVAPDEPASPLVTLAACGVSDPALEVPDPEVPPGSSAHARPLFHP